MTTLLMISLVTIAIIIGSASVGAMINDLRAAQRIRRANTNKRKWADPLVTVIVTVPTDAIATKNTLEHILESTYRPLEIILVGNLHQRAKLKKLTLLLADPTRPVSLFTGNGGERAAYRRHGHGEIILTLDTDYQLDQRAIERAVQHLSTSANPPQLQPYMAASIHDSSVGLLQAYADALVLSWRKLLNFVATIRRVYKTDASFYRVDAFMNEPQGFASKTFFADDVVMYTPAANLNYSLAKEAFAGLSRTYRALWQARSVHPLTNAYWRLLACCLGGMLLTLPVTLTYAALLATTALQPTLLFIITAVASTCLLIGIWSHQTTTGLQKLSISYLLPVSLLPLYLATFAYAIMTVVIIAQSVYNVTLRLIKPARKLQSD